MILEIDHEKRRISLGLKQTKSNIILTTKNLSQLVPKSKKKIIVNNVLFSVAKLTLFI